MWVNYTLIKQQKLVSGQHTTQQIHIQHRELFIAEFTGDEEVNSRIYLAMEDTKCRHKMFKIKLFKRSLR